MYYNLAGLKPAPIKDEFLSQLLTAEYSIEDLKGVGFEVPEHSYVKEEVEIQLKYEPYIEREKKGLFFSFFKPISANWPVQKHNKEKDYAYISVHCKKGFVYL